MGTGAFVKEHSNHPDDEQKASPRRYSIDIPLMLTLTALIVFGLTMLFSASWDFSLLIFDSATYLFTRQLMWLGIGIILAFLLSRLDYHYWRKLVIFAMLGAIISLIMVLIVSESRHGAVRTILDGSVQPSELAKLVTVIYLSAWLYSKREQISNVQLGLLPLGVILGIIGGLIYLQPDLSAVGTVLILGGLLFFIAGGDLKQITILLLAALFFGWLVVKVSPTGQQRIQDFWTGIMDPMQASYHVRRSLEAIVKGGIFGVGIGRADTKLTGLPVPPTDSIFAVITEELGLFGAIGTLGLYAMLVWRGLVIARRAPDMLGTLLASGLVFWIGIEALINMTVMVGLMPFAGNALPFISAGGSNLVASLSAIGILLNVSRQSRNAALTDEEWREYSATLDLRRRNRRRRVSRPVRSAECER
ncbi:MAG: cell division protein FtsW [Anaerolineales bacterium]|nr:cell division protein FtsW [Anaerolineales bacterium]